MSSEFRTATLQDYTCKEFPDFNDWAKHMKAKDIRKEMLPIWAAFLCRYPLLPYFLPTKRTHNSTLFYRGTCIQGRRHLVTAATSVQSRAYRSLCVTLKLDNAAI
jgi:hypothetical protein